MNVTDIAEVLTNPQVALELDVVLTNRRFLRFQQRLFDIARSLLKIKAQLLDGLVDGHAADKARDVPHLLRAVLDVLLHMTHKLEIKFD